MQVYEQYLFDLQAQPNKSIEIVLHFGQIEKIG